MKKKITYIADNGKEFCNYEACKLYEEEQSKLKQYHVDVTFAAYGYATVMAKNVEEAKKEAIRYIKEECYPEDYDFSDEPIAVVVTERS
jgi:hypothetical protein